MEKYFAYKGSSSLEEAKQKKIENTKFHLSSREIAIKRCNRIWGNNSFSLYTFEDFNDNSSFTKIL